MHSKTLIVFLFYLRSIPAPMQEPVIVVYCTKAGNLCGKSCILLLIFLYHECLERKKCIHSIIVAFFMIRCIAS